MKIVHTSDWHVGRRWKGIQRLDEIEAVLDHLAEFIEREAVDLVLHTGDVFDRRNPPAEAERLVNRFFVRVGKAGAHMVVIAGNHDDAQRLDARSLLARVCQRPDPGQTSFCATRWPSCHWHAQRRKGSRRRAAVRVSGCMGLRTRSCWGRGQREK